MKKLILSSTVMIFTSLAAMAMHEEHAANEQPKKTWVVNAMGSPVSLYVTCKICDKKVMATSWQAFLEHLLNAHKENNPRKQELNVDRNANRWSMDYSFEH